MPRIIAHRGNLYGPSPLENNPDYVRATYSKGFDVEIDVWWKDSKWYLGHCKPQYEVSQSFLETGKQNGSFWCHAKNEDAFKALLQTSVNCFWHDQDVYTITSHQCIWSYPNAKNLSNAVWNQPEWNRIEDLYLLTPECLNKWFGVCSDYAALIKTIQDGELLEQ